jgi:type IV pilus assembly protein PilW
VRAASGEPTLACTYQDPGTSTWKTEALVAGVEGFQVLYGVDNVTPGTAATSATYAATSSVADRYLRAAQLDVAGNAAATVNNWRRVRSLRIALLTRGPALSAVDKAATARTINVLGDGFVASGDVGSALTVPADGRIRDRQIYTVHLRNAQYAP